MVPFPHPVSRDLPLLGQSLVKYGRTQLKLASLQEEYATALSEGFIAGVERTMADIAEYQSQRKKLDSRRYVFAGSLLI
jgi:hypothetical protein